MAKTVKKKDSFSKLSFREVLGMQSHRFLKLIVVAVYACISYYIVTYINDINKLEECSKILPIQKNILYGYGVPYFTISKKALNKTCATVTIPIKYISSLLFGDISLQVGCFFISLV